MEREISKKSKHNEDSCDWKIFESWYSFGSPIGLSLGFAIVLSSIGLFIYLLHLSNLIGK
jgi:hypothetical protein